MHGFRTSFSVPRHRKSSSDDNASGDHELWKSSQSQPRSSLDTMIINGRTRYPSDKKHMSDPTSTDLQVAASLLNQDLSVDDTMFEEPRTNFFPTRTGRVVEHYNQIARQHGLEDLTTLQESSREDEESAKHAPKHWYQRLARKSSVQSLVARRSQHNVKCQSLDDTCRLGGVSTIQLPCQFTAGHLAIPTSLAATANFLIKHGRDTPGIFRIPGQTSIVGTLHEYYNDRMMSKEPDQVQATVGFNELPTHIAANTHDVASAFKKFLWDIPGGILGSVALFKTLKDICDLEEVTAVQGVKSRLVALALLSLHSQRRFSLISAVFGLLAFLKQDAGTAVDTSASKSNLLTPESMSSRALGVVFAPILLGNMTEQIELAQHQESPLSNKVETAKRGLGGYRKPKNKAKESGCGPEMAAGLERTTSAAKVVENLVQNWEDIIRHILTIEATSASPISLFSVRNLSYSALGTKKENDFLRHQRSSSVIYRPRGSRSTSLSKSISYPILSMTDRSVRPSSGNIEPEVPLVQRSASVAAYRHDKVRNKDLHLAGSAIRQGSLSTTALSGSDGKDWPTSQSESEQGLSIESESSKEAFGGWGKGWEERLKEPSGISVSPDTSLGDSLYNISRSTRRNVTEESHVSNSPEVQLACSGLKDVDTIADFAPLTSCAERGEEVVSGIEVRSLSSPDPSFLAVKERYISARLAKKELDAEINIQMKPAMKNTQEIPSTRLIKDEDLGLALPAESCPQGSTPRRKKMSSSGSAASSTPQSMIPRPVTDPSRGRKNHLPSHLKDDAKFDFSNQQIVTKSSPLPERFNESRSHSKGKRAENMAEYGSEFLRMQDQSRDRDRDSAVGVGRHPALLPFAHEFPTARNFPPRQGRGSDQWSFSNNPSSEDFEWPPSGLKVNVGTLYAEIRRLKVDLDSKYEEKMQLTHQLDAMRRYKDSGTLSEKLRETERELRFWRDRALSAEKGLVGGLRGVGAGSGREGRGSDTAKEYGRGVGRGSWERGREELVLTQ